MPGTVTGTLLLILNSIFNIIWQSFNQVINMLCIYTTMHIIKGKYFIFLK